MSLERYLNDLDKIEELEAGLLFELEETAPDELHNKIVARMIDEHTLCRKKRLNYKLLSGLAAAILIFVGARSIYLPFYNLKKSEETGYLRNKKELSKNIVTSKGAPEQIQGVTQYFISGENTSTDKNMSTTNTINDKTETTKKDTRGVAEKNMAKNINNEKLQQENNTKVSSEENHSHEISRETKSTVMKNNNDINDEVLNKKSNIFPSDTSEKGYVVNYQLYITDEEEEQVNLILASSIKLSENIFSLTEEEFKNLLEKINSNNIQLKMLNEIKEDNIVIEILKKQP